MNAASVDIKHDLRGKEKKSGGYPLKVQVIFNRKTKLYGIGIDLSIKDFERIWNGKRLNIDDKETKTEINTFLFKAMDCIKELKDSFTFDRFEDLFLDNKGFADSLVNAFDERISEYVENQQIGTSTVYVSAKNAFVAFLKTSKKKDLGFGELDAKLLKKYKQWLNDNYTGATISNYFQKLKTVYDENVKSGKVKIKTLVNPFYRITVPKISKAKFALNEVERDLLFNYEAKKDNHVFVLDMCRLTYEMNGINMVDLAHSKFEQYNKDEKRFWFYRHKTSSKTANPKRLIMTLSDKAVELIEKYRNTKRNIAASKDFLFPFLIDEKLTKINIALVKNLNSKIFEFFDNCPIVELKNRQITQYTFRRTFAVDEYLRTKDIMNVRNKLGHSSVTQTETYLQTLGVDTNIRETIKTNDEKVS